MGDHDGEMAEVVEDVHTVPEVGVNAEHDDLAQAAALVHMAEDVPVGHMVCRSRAAEAADT
jgi:uncharacterized protein YgfB (UPF0149 family)